MRFKKIYIELNKRVPYDMSVEEFEIVLNKIKNYTKYIYLHVKGEPLIHPQLESILDLCTKYDMNVNITTNGTNISKVSDILLFKCIRQVNFSLHSYVLNNKEQYIDDIFEYASRASKLGKYIQYRFWAHNAKYSDNENYFLDRISSMYNIDKDDLIGSNSKKIANNIYISNGREFIWPDINNSYYETCGTCYALKIILQFYLMVILFHVVWIVMALLN